MATPDQHKIRLRIVIDHPVAGVLHSLQAKDDHPLNPIASMAGEPIAFEFAIRVAPGPRFLGDQVRREGPTRRFVYIRVGKSAGDPTSPWDRRMKVDIHDIPAEILGDAVAGRGVVELVVHGTGRDGSPACATVSVKSVRLD